MKTCRHFRFRLPREDADELRDADPLPCDLCDSLPHRRARRAEAADTRARVGAGTLTRVIPTPRFATFQSLPQEVLDLAINAS